MALKNEHFILKAYISLLEKRVGTGEISLPSICFTQEEIAKEALTMCASKITPQTVNQCILGRSIKSLLFLQEFDKESFLNGYCRIRSDREFFNDNSRFLEEVVASFDEGNRDKINDLLFRCFEFINAFQIPTQEEFPGLSTQAACWLAAGVLAYNEYQRSHSANSENYLFEGSAIGRVARTYNHMNSEVSCTYMAINQCAKGRNNQGYAYVIPVKKKRRVAKYGVGDGFAPNINTEFVVQTIIGPKKTSTIIDFLKNEYCTAIDFSSEFELLNDATLSEKLAQYKDSFNERWSGGERVKWDAVECFKNNFDINADDFSSMFEAATRECETILNIQHSYPRKMIIEMAKQAPDNVRGMFVRLYDEETNLFERINAFINAANQIVSSYNPGNWKNHYQDIASISVYLWLRYPEKYYIYRFEMLKNASVALGCNTNPTKGKTEENYEFNSKLLDAINNALINYPSLKVLFDSVNDERSYDDSALKIMTYDVLHFIAGKEKDESNQSIYENNQVLSEAEDTNENLENDQKVDEILEKPYTENDFLAEVFMTRDALHEMKNVLSRKKNIILQGAPGVGKTFTAKRLAYVMMGCKDAKRVELVQFHQNYSYEDFIMGYRPTETGFTLRTGLFYNFCKKAEADPDRDYFFIIDEINRGNVSKIFGELLMLIENNYRGTSVNLAYSAESFFVPKNLYIIGMMNTADRSLAMIDYALRRRFGFFEIAPGFESEGFKSYQASFENECLDAVIEAVKSLNENISEDASLGRGFCIGHSYFCNMSECTDDLVKSIVEYDILPMLREYWFDNPSKVEDWEHKFRGIFND